LANTLICREQNRRLLQWHVNWKGVTYSHLDLQIKEKGDVIMSKLLKRLSVIRFATWAALCLIVLCLSGCADLPRDARQSTERIRAAKVLVVGLPSSQQELAVVAERERVLVERVAKRLGAHVQWKVGNAHTLLQDLEQVRLPLVAATLPSDSPFATSVGLSQPHWRKGPQDKDYCLAVAPGENRLLLLVDQVIAEEQKS
jgi:hypothetical protein